MFKFTTNIKNAIEHLKNDKNNAVSHVFLDAKNSEGLLSKTTYVLKDVFAHSNSTSEGSSDFLKGFKPFYNSTIITKLQKEGAALVGKTNLDEFGLGATGTFSSKGVILNPLDSTRIVGGSSSGSAAIFNEKLSFAIGTDTGDSVRLPASFVGKVGFKPSYGSVSRYGLFPFASSLDTVGWFTHNVQDSNILAKVLYGKDEKDFTSLDVKMNIVKAEKPKTIGIFNCYKFLGEETSKKFNDLINILENEGIKINVLEIPEEYLLLIQVVYRIISYSEASTNLANLNGMAFGNKKHGNNWEEIMINTRSENFGYMVQKRLTLGAYFLDVENQEDLFLRAQKVRRILKDSILSFFNKLKIDMILMPSSPEVAPKIDSISSNEKNNYGYMPYILTLSNLVGNPSISIPWITSQNEKLPINITIETNIYDDEKLFSYSLFLEEFLSKKGIR
ncbi:amidase family protein [[Mycoplasma] mobile]|uniref:Glutamyl-tRNA amidotransferase subunit A n=1 Tax=Mycoplasma mobile (strain ATCC 43663 / 163K / NCTC 11711) TaxID=267748 RepID=Q6KHR5_MYCM1|nr:amidase family protein [[Mycoplasma] mobile]AAT27863.1 glutamyl-tRNA amidotransferase subunit A [Mycoplasma mobile 163K]